MERLKPKYEEVAEFIYGKTKDYFSLMHGLLSKLDGKI